MQTQPIKPLYPQLNRYEILELIGQGQHGQVYRAIHRITKQEVALKQLNPNHFSTHQFLRELNCLTRFNHRNILKCYGLEYAEMDRYLVMDYCSGGNLRDWMKKDISYSIIDKLLIIRDILKGLAYAHQKDVIHCDIKPENILIDEYKNRYRARLADFGIAQLQATPDFDLAYEGSPAYKAPERYYGHLSKASDLYSVGIILFELLLEYRPFQGSPLEVMNAHLNQLPQIPKDLPLLLRSLLSRSLSKLPQHRFSTADDMIKALELCRAAASVVS
jgi:serine/threonine-protein kinase